MLDHTIALCASKEQHAGVQSLQSRVERCLIFFFVASGKGAEDLDVQRLKVFWDVDLRGLV